MNYNNSSIQKLDTNLVKYIHSKIPNIFKKIFLKSNISNQKQVKINKKFRIFDCKYETTVTLDEYVSRVVEFTQIEPFTLLYSLLLIDRLCISHKKFQNEDGIFFLTEENIFKVFFTSVYISMKFIEDEIFDDLEFSSIAGISIKEIYSLERTFLEMIKYRIYINSNYVYVYLNQFIISFNKDMKKIQNRLVNI